GGVSFNHLVGAAEERDRNGKAERLGGLEVDEQLDLSGLLDWQVGRLLALKNPTCVDASETVRVTTSSIAHQAAGCGEITILINRWHSVKERQRGGLVSPANEECIGAYNKAASPRRPRKRAEGWGVDDLQSASTNRAAEARLSILAGRDVVAVEVSVLQIFDPLDPSRLLRR